MQPLQEQPQDIFMHPILRLKKKESQLTRKYTYQGRALQINSSCKKSRQLKCSPVPDLDKTNQSLSAISITYEKEKSAQIYVIAKDEKSLFQIYVVIIINTKNGFKKFKIFKDCADSNMRKLHRHKYRLREENRIFSLHLTLDFSCSHTYTYLKITDN